MKHFENNVNDGMSRTDSIETLIDLTSCIAVNALMVAGGEAEANEKDAGAWWAMIALAEAALEGYPEDVRAKGYQVVNENTNRELVEQARRKEAEQAAKLGMDEGESVMGMVLPGDYSGYMIFFFENGKAAKVELSAYKTTSNRRRLTGAYSDKSPLKALLHLKEDREIAVYSTEPRVLIVNTALLGVKTTRTTQGVALLTLKKKYVLDTVRFPEETGITDLARYRGRSIPATGALLKTEDSDDKQLSLI